MKDFSITPQEGSCLVEVTYAPIGGVATVSVFYYMAADGSLSVVESLSDAGGLSDAPDLFRFGMRFAMPGAYDTVDFFGLGPWENYVDRCSAALLGRYRQKVADQYHYGYVRTQESGTHTGLRFFRVLLPRAGRGREWPGDGFGGRFQCIGPAVLAGTAGCGGPGRGYPAEESQ